MNVHLYVDLDEMTVGEREKVISFINTNENFDVVLVKTASAHNEERVKAELDRKKIPHHKTEVLVRETFGEDDLLKHEFYLKQSRFLDGSLKMLLTKEKFLLTSLKEEAIGVYIYG